MDIKPIRTKEDYEAALEALEQLWARAKPGTSDGDRFDVLATLVDAYEREHFPVPAPDPIEAIRFKMEQKGLSNRALVDIFKTRARTSEVLNRKRALNLKMIRKLHDRLDIPVHVLVREYPLNKKRPGRRASKRSGHAA